MDFLEQITKNIFNYKKIHVDEIYLKLAHKKSAGKFTPPERKFVKNLKLNNWRWKMVLNTETERFTILWRKNKKDKELKKDLNSIKLTLSSFMIYLENITIFHKNHKRNSLNINENISAFFRNQFITEKSIKD